MPTFTYEIDDSNAIHMWDGVNPEPFLFQPHWPDSTPWADRAEAQAWAEAKVAELTDDTAPWAGFTPSQPTIPRPTVQETAEAKLASIGLTVEELKALLG
jgi:hypothetical protein